ncbi:HAD family hydrolase [Bowmanella yangjiangensis]|uniref:HAD-IA family hydrolase n=1 Tax=Bowmanella yangjiangensis TaxID=2811230 RepID=A0ABS3CN28_9ALTE|nr:HAD-IA family hydrolase [Bowmanella yangjiangensis]MBN7818518.1 HAD-IA family hydrolase [Bowmanella yangjiangensis]
MVSCAFDLDAYQAVIFDMDGTLLDSADAIRQVCSRWCAIHQLDVEQVLAMCHGSRIRDFLPELAPHLDADLEEAWLNAEEAEETNGIVPIEGAHAMLRLLELRGTNWGIATSSAGPVARMRLGTLGFPIPQVLITAEYVKRGKPDPEHFELAAKHLNAEPDRCLAFEDSANGVAAALAAGCDVVVVGEAGQYLYPQHQRIVGRISDYQSILAVIEQTGVR